MSSLHHHATLKSTLCLNTQPNTQCHNTHSGLLQKYHINSTEISSYSSAQLTKSFTHIPRRPYFSCFLHCLILPFVSYMRYISYSFLSCVLIFDEKEETQFRVVCCNKEIVLQMHPIFKDFKRENIEVRTNGIGQFFIPTIF